MSDYIEYCSDNKTIGLREDRLPKVGPCCTLHLFQNSVYWGETILVDLELYRLLEQAMPHIKAIVEKVNESQQ